MRQEGRNHNRTIYIATGIMQRTYITAPSLRQPLRQLKEKLNRENYTHQSAGGRGAGTGTPSANQEEQRCRAQQAAAKIVQDFPAIDHRQGVRRQALLLSIRTLRKDPRSVLPIAADPAVLPLAVARVVVWKLFEELHVR